MKIAVYGGSGYTGKLVATELHRRNLNVVLVGRDAERLREAAPPGAETRQAGLEDAGALAETFRDCDVVINCVAPFITWGEPVVRAAIAARTSYLDISGEQLYVKRIFDALHEPARRAGVSAVPMVNDGGFLADLLTGLTAEKVERITDITVVHRNFGGSALSRGSGRTALANMESFTNGGLVYQDREWHAEMPVKTSSVIFPGDTERSPVVKFAMPEIVTIPRHIHTWHLEALAEAHTVQLFAGVTPELVERIPERPAEDNRRSVHFVLIADVEGESGRARGTVEGADTYGTTAIIAVEAARRLATDGAEPGVLAPTRAFDARSFLDFLAPHGVRWSVTG